MSKTIQLFTGRGVNHAFLAWQDPHLGWVVLGANANGITLDTWSNFSAKRYVPALFRPKDGLPTLWTGLEKLRNDLNAKYNYGGLLGMSVVEIAHHFHHDMRNPWSRDWELFCSQFATEVIRGSGYQLLAKQYANTIDPHEAMHVLASAPMFFQVDPRICASS